MLERLGIVIKPLLWMVPSAKLPCFWSLLRIYDQRKIDENENHGVLKKFCPHHLVRSLLCSLSFPGSSHILLPCWGGGGLSPGSLASHFSCRVLNLLETGGARWGPAEEREVLPCPEYGFSLRVFVSGCPVLCRSVGLHSQAVRERLVTLGKALVRFMGIAERECWTRRAQGKVASDL